MTIPLYRCNCRLGGLTLAGIKKMSLCHKLEFSNPSIFATWGCKNLIFQTYDQKEFII